MARSVLPLALVFMIPALLAAVAQERELPPPEKTEVWEPEPAVVHPGGRGKAPSDAVVLFDGTDLSKWTGRNGAAEWTVADGAMTVKPGTGSNLHRRGLRRRAAPCRVAHPDRDRRREPGPRQQRRLPDGALRGAGARLVREPQLLERAGGQHLQAAHPARERLAGARRVADLRHRLHGAALPERRQPGTSPRR